MATLKLSRIRIDGGTQPRAQINFVLVADYAEAMKSGTQFPPITMFFDDMDYWLADGFHRFSAAQSPGRAHDAARAVSRHTALVEV